MVLARHPFCDLDCKKQGLLTPSTIADHINPDPSYEDRWSLTNGQGACVSCHNRKTANEQHQRARHG